MQTNIPCPSPTPPTCLADVCLCSPSSSPSPQLPFYMTLVNCTWVGLWTGLTFTTIILLVLEYGVDSYGDNAISHTSPAAVAYRKSMTMVSRRFGGVWGSGLRGWGCCWSPWWVRVCGQ